LEAEPLFQGHVGWWDRKMVVDPARLRLPTSPIVATCESDPVQGVPGRAWTDVPPAAAGSWEADYAARIAAAGSPQAEPTAEERRTYVYVDHSCQSLIEHRLLAMLEGAAADGPAPQEPDDLNPARMLRLTEAQAGRFFLAVCHAYGPLTPARLAGWLAEED
jgi:hypothetical protein